jgi:hypothetical protein
MSEFAIAQLAEIDEIDETRCPVRPVPITVSLGAVHPRNRTLSFAIH